VNTIRSGSSWIWFGALVGVIAVGAFFRAYELGEECFDCDELYAVRIHGTSLKTVGQVIGRDGFHTNHPPLMTVPYLYWGAVFGLSETSIRALPCLLGILSLVLIYRLGLRLGGPVAGLIAAAALALNPLHIAYSREARQYAMMVFLVLGAHLFFLRSLQDGQKRDRIVYFVFTLLAIFTHYFAIPALAPHGVIALWVMVTGSLTERRNAIVALLTLALSVMPFLAWLPAVKYQSSFKWPHLQGGGAGDILICLSDVAGLGRQAGPLLWSAVVALAVLALAGLWQFRAAHLTFHEGSDDAPLPRRAGLFIAKIGFLTALALWFATPIYLAPTAKEILASYGYDQETVDKELSVLRLALTLFPVTFALQGICLTFWPSLIGLLERLPRIGQKRTLSSGLFVAGLIIVPILFVRVVALMGVPFVSSRNLLIMAPPLALALGMGMSGLVRSRSGQVVAAASIICLILAAAQYETIAVPFGGRGYELGLHTGPWRKLGDGLRAAVPADTELVSINLPVTDPALYYLPDYKHRRVEKIAELPPEVTKSHFIFLHLQNNYGSNQLVKAFRKQGGTLQSIAEADELVVYDVDLQSAKFR
jgi:uncharacterized membrane protein